MEVAAVWNAGQVRPLEFCNTCARGTVERVATAVERAFPGRIVMQPNQTRRARKLSGQGSSRGRPRAAAAPLPARLQQIHSMSGKNFPGTTLQTWNSENFSLNSMTLPPLPPPLPHQWTKTAPPQVPQNISMSAKPGMSPHCSPQL